MTPTQPTGPEHAVHHDTHRLPPGGFYFAPGAIEQPRAARTSRWPALAEAALLLALGLLIGVAAGVLHAWGLPL